MLALLGLAAWLCISSLGCDATSKILDSQPMEGWGCCRDDQLTYNECVPVAQESSFSPPLEYTNGSKAPSDLVVWTPYDLMCPLGFKINWFGVDGNNSALILEEDGVKVKWRELIYKLTNHFCVAHDPDEGYRAAICQPDLPNICSGATCINKCCAEGEVLSGTTCRMPRKDVNFSLEFHSISGSPAKPPPNALVVSLIPDCKPITLLHPKKDPVEKYYLLPSGQLYKQRTEERYGIDSYCIEYTERLSAEVAIVCLESTSTTLLVKDYMQTIGVVTSAIFLMVTILFHVFIPELRDMQGLCLLCHMTSLFVGDCALFVSYVYSHQLTHFHCVINGFILQLSFLATFFWLNVMCFDIWRVIRATVSCIPLIGILANDAKKFMVYTAYAWGGPLIMTVVTVVLHNLPDQPTFSNLIRPGFSEGNCWLPDGNQRLIYFYALVALLFFINMVLLGHSVFMLYQAGSAFQCFVRQVSVTAFNRHHLEMFWQRFSLFILMALCWVTEVFSWKIRPREMWLVTDVLNAFQGFMVFLIFIKSEKKRELVKGALKRVFATVSSAARKFSTSSSGATFHVDTSTVYLSAGQEQQMTSTESQEEQGRSK